MDNVKDEVNVTFLSDFWRALLPSFAFVKRILWFCLPLLLSWEAAFAQGATNLWAAEIWCHSDSSPAIGNDGTIYFGAFDGSFWALNPSGSRKWVFRAQSEIRSAPAVAADGTIYCGCRDRKLYALGPDGKKRWEFKTGAWVDSSPAIGTDGSIYFGSWDKNLYALKPDGSKRWQFHTGAPIVSSPAIGKGGTIFFGSHDKKIYALTPDGSKAWDFATGGPIISSPAIGEEGGLYFTSVDGWLYALDASGSLRWRLRTGGVTQSSPSIGTDGTLYVGVNTALWAVTPDGHKKWEWSDGFTIDVTPLVAADNSVCFASWYGMLFDLTPKTEPNWRFYLCNNYGYSCPALATDGTLYSPDCSHEFHALGNSLRLAKSPWPKFRANTRNTGNVADRVN